MKHLIVIIITISISFAIYCSSFTLESFSQKPLNNINTANSNNNVDIANWISAQNDLNVTMILEPKIPIIDEMTSISFNVGKLNSSDIYKDLNARVTITDHDGRLFKFNNQYFPITNGKLSVTYIFPDDGVHRIILQLYKNTNPFAMGSFDVIVPPVKSPADIFAWLFQPRPY